MRAVCTGVLLSMCIFADVAAAQPAMRELHEPSFDMWCQEQQHLSPRRCDKRLPADDAAYRDFLDTYERYETQRLNQQAKDRRINRAINANPLNPPPGQP